jgi:hypothetical protein
MWREWYSVYDAYSPTVVIKIQINDSIEAHVFTFNQIISFAMQIKISKKLFRHSVTIGYFTAADMTKDDTITDQQVYSISYKF